MSNAIVPSIADEQLANIETLVEWGLRLRSEEIKLLVESYRHAREALLAAELDTRRLNFMTADPCVMQCQNGINSPFVYRLYWPQEGEHQDAWYPSEREAIDAAMERQS